MNNTVCVCNETLCNDFGFSSNATTPAPVPMTTGNTTMTCYYGMQVLGLYYCIIVLLYYCINTTLQRNKNESEVWQAEICGPQETACMTVDIIDV